MVFDPVQATANLLGIVKGGLLLSGFASAVGLLFKARPGGALAAVLAGILLYHLLESGQYYWLGEEMARLLTLYIKDI